MPVRRRRLPSASFYPQDQTMDKNDCFVAGQGAKYLENILTRYPHLDASTMGFACWILGSSLMTLTDRVTAMLSKSQAIRLQEELEDALDHFDYGEYLVKAINHNRNKHNRIVKEVCHMLQHRQHELSSSRESKLEKNTRQFQKLFSLTDDEVELCLFIFLIESWDQFRQIFHSHLEVTTYPGHKFLCAALGITQARLAKTTGGNLKKLEIISQEHYGLEMNSDFLSMFIDPSNRISHDNLYRQAKPSEIPLSFHMISPHEVNHIELLLQEKRQVPTHILLYGPPGTGKTSFARAMVEHLAVPAYDIMQEKKNRSSKRRAAMQACLNMTNNGQGSVIIVDEADRMLNTISPFFFEEAHDKGWLNSFLEEPGVRAIWIVNNTDGIEDSVLRRFSYSLYFPHFSRQKRIQLWKTIVGHNKAGRYFKKDTIHKLAENYKVSPGIIDLAIKQARATDKSGLSFAKRVRMSLDAHLRLSNQGLLPKKQDSLDRDFTLEGLNIHGDIQETIDQLEYFNTQIRQGQDYKVLQYNLLFYGPPGTGKSQLAKYLAKELDRDIMIRRGSDLLGMFVGETEKLIARMFAEAEAREAVLVVDEADSFIFGREMAHRSWEVSMVNEFLTCMESYQGILICTTNRFKGLDNASIRRFNQKLYFDCLNNNGVEIFYRKFLSPLCDDKMLPEHLTRLGRLTNLTPGDFKNIRDIHIMRSNTVNHKSLLAALEQESRLKEQQEGKKCGF
ncbi:AAA family ATPase [Desulfonatronovibrio magnus]|uniref:AAA family ATPase n=1 Tax=Desulfonatronovibrio magnus TaxID=698827 RepID=UPI0005EB1FCA|nr:ATP-binding protein [Desulfonatronovibrio magnus]